MKIERTVTLKVEHTIVKMVKSISIDGQIVRPGGFAEVSRMESVELIRSGAAVAATPVEVEDAALIVKSFTVDPGPDASQYRAAVREALQS